MSTKPLLIITWLVDMTHPKNPTEFTNHPKYWGNKNASNHQHDQHSFVIVIVYDHGWCLKHMFAQI